MTPGTPAVPLPLDAKSTNELVVPLIASMMAAALAASEMPAVPIAILSAAS